MLSYIDVTIILAIHAFMQPKYAVMSFLSLSVYDFPLVLELFFVEPL